MAKFAKNAAYCAIFTLIMGCATQNLTITTDELSNESVRERARTIYSLEAAQNIEKSALSRQKSADSAFIHIKNSCLEKILVNKCIDSARENRNAIWDEAHKELISARFFIRNDEANKNRIALTKKLTDHQADELANIPVRATNVSAFNAKQAAYAQRQLNYAVKQATVTSERAASVTAFEEKQRYIEEVQKKRLQDNEKRLAEAQVKKASEIAQYHP